MDRTKAAEILHKAKACYATEYLDCHMVCDMCKYHVEDSLVVEAIDTAIKALDKDTNVPSKWIPVSERTPSKEERKEWIDKNLGGIGYLYPCLVTRYSSINPDRTKNNPYVAKHYFDGEDFLNAGEEVCSEYIIAWMPLPEPWEGE